MKNVLDKKFSHARMFKGSNLTRKQAMEYFAQNRDTTLSKKPSKIQSSNIFDPTQYDDILVCEGYQYRLTQEEKEYYLERFEFWEKWYQMNEAEYLDFGHKMKYDEWLEYEKSEKMKVSEYAEFWNAFKNGGAK